MWLEARKLDTGAPHYGRCGLHVVEALAQQQGVAPDLEEKPTYTPPRHATYDNGETLAAAASTATAAAATAGPVAIATAIAMSIGNCNSDSNGSSRQ